jgi:hypothetical protein
MAGKVIKTPISTIRQRAEKLNLTLLSPENLGSHVKLNFRCKNHGIEVQITPSALKNGSGCWKCGNERTAEKLRTPIEIIRKRAKKLNLVLLSPKNLGSHVKLDFRCPIHNMVVQIAPTGIQSGQGCWKCGEERTALKQTTPIEEIRSIALKKSATLMIKKRSDTHASIKLKCNLCKTKFELTLPTLKKSSVTIACLRCRPRPITKSIEIADFKSLCKSFNLICLEKLSGRSGGKSGTTFKWKCRQCGDIFIKDPHAMRINPGCPSCKVLYLGESITRLSFKTMFHAPFQVTRVPWLKDTEDPEGRIRSLDGYEEKLGIAFEHQGSQHNKFVKGWHISRERFAAQKRIDELRVDLCKQHGVKLAIVPDLVNDERILAECYADGPMLPIPEAVITSCKRSGIKLPDNYRELRIDVRKLVRKTDREKIKELQKVADRKNFKIVMPDYPFGNDTKLPAECLTCGKNWGVTPGKIKAGKGCPRCAGIEKIPRSALDKIAARRNLSIETPDYKNSQQRIEVRCNFCGRKWETTGTKINRGLVRCLTCEPRVLASSILNKKKIKEFFGINNRLPARTGKKEERRLTTLLHAYCNKNGKSFDQDFSHWARTKGYGSKIHIWTKEECRLAASPYGTRGAFQKGNRKAYDSASHHGWLDEICQHMNPEWGKLTKERCLEAFNKCKDKRNFYKEFPSEYGKASDKGWLKEFYNSAGIQGHKKRVTCVETGKTYNSIAELAKDMKLQPANILAVLKGRRKHAGGYTFQYVQS